MCTVHQNVIINNRFSHQNVNIDAANVLFFPNKANFTIGRWLKTNSTLHTQNSELTQYYTLRTNSILHTQNSELFFFLKKIFIPLHRN
jgi:hypothetical protein